MLVSLTSHNEPNPARFKNHFHSPITIKKFSYICLVAGQIIKDAEQKIVTVAPDTLLNVRIDAYNIFQLTLNPAGAASVEFTASQLVAALNAARQANVALQPSDSFYEFQIGETDQFAFKLVFFNRMAYDTAIPNGLKLHLYGAQGADYYQQKWLLINGFTDTIPTSQGGVNRAEIPNIPGNYGLGIAWDETYYDIPVNQTNRNACSVYTSANQSSQIIASNTTITNINLANTKWTWGPGIANDAVPPVYTNTATLGQPLFDERWLTIEFQQNIGYNIYVFNNNTGTHELVSFANSYSAGDSFGVVLQTDPANPPQTQANLAYPTIFHNQTNGLLFMYVGKMGDIANRPAGANYLLRATTTENNDLTNSSNMSFVYDYDRLENIQEQDQPAQDQIAYAALFDGNNNASWVGNTAIGTGAGIGYRNALTNNFIGTNPGWIYDQTLGRPATFPFLNSGETQITTAQFRNATGCWGFNTFADGIARGSLQVEIPNVYKISAVPFTFNGPSLLQVHFVMGDTTGMYNAGDANTSHRVLFANGPTASTTIAINNAEAWDVRMAFENSRDNLPLTQEEFTLNNVVGGARINFRMSSTTLTSYNYTWWMDYRAQTGSYQIFVNEQERTAPGVVTNNLFASAVRVIGAGSSRPAPITHMGGCDPTNALFIGGGGATQYRYQNMSALTMFSNLRLYQRTSANGDAPDPFTALIAILQANFQESFTRNNGLIPGGANLPNPNFYPNFRRQIMFPTAAQQAVIEHYSNIPYVSPERTNSVFVAKTTPDANNGKDFPRLGWYDFANIYYQSDIHTPFTGAFKTLPAGNMQDLGQGIVDPTLIDTIIDFESPGQPDANGNYLVNPGYQDQQGPLHPTGQINMDFDIVDIPSEKIKIQLPNLPHNSYNGFTKTPDKTIYEIPYAIHEKVDNDQAIIEVEPPAKCWIPLNNAGEIPLNEIDVRIADVENREMTGLRPDTNIVIQIEDNVNLLN